MKNTTDNVKKVPRFGILDFVIILLVIIAVLGVFFRTNIINMINNTKDLQKYTVSYTIENVRYTTPNFISVEDKVYFASNGEQFGTIINASENMSALDTTLPSENFTTATGEIVEVFYPNNETRVKAMGRLECDGRYSSDGSFLVNGKEHIAMGQYIDVKTEYVTVTIRIDEITVVNA
ncbi:MAG: DUF4330 family protein [Ruminococcaceae bacterium]|nr:DUF4330 family protein [Oscillospiraceae bacterium]